MSGWLLWPFENGAHVLPFAAVTVLEHSRESPADCSWALVCGAAAAGPGFLQDGSGLTRWSVTDAGPASSRAIEPPMRPAQGADRTDRVELAL